MSGANANKETDHADAGKEVSTTLPPGPAEPMRQMTSAADADRGAVVFVWGVWALMLLVALLLVGSFGSASIPVGDDWDSIVPALTGAQPITFEWLWSQTNEHRVLLPRLLLLAVLKPTEDFRAVMFLNVAAMGTVALWMILIAKRLRGRMSYTDAFFSLVLLNLAQFENFLTAWQIQMVSSTVLAAVLLCLIAGRDSLLTASVAVVAGICVLLLPLCGANGLALVPALAVWLGHQGVLTWRSPAAGRKWKALLLLVFASASLLLVVFYFIGYQKPSYHPPSAGVWPSLLASLEFVSGGVGTVPAQTFWPYLGLALLGLTVISLVVLARVWCGRPQERIRAAGLLMFLGAVGALTLGIGWGRSGFGSGAGIVSRYTTLAAPALCALYFVWVLRSKRVGQFVQMVLFLLMATSLWTNNSDALAGSRERRERTRAFERDLDAGAPPSLLAERYSTLYIPDPEGRLMVEAMLYHLHRAGIGPFRSMKEDLATGEVAFPVVPVAMNQMTWKDGVGEGNGDDPYLVFALPEPQLVHAIRIKYAYERTAFPVVLQVFWRRSGEQEFVEEERNHTKELKAEVAEGTATVWANDTIDQFRINPDVKPFVIRITKIELLVPTADHARVEHLYEDVAYQHLIRHIREVVRSTVPLEATVLVASKGDDDLLKLDGRKGWHFPRDEQGNYAGNPADSQQAIAQLERLRAKGAQFLLFPEPYFWWLEHYKEFKEHLDRHYRRIWGDERCVIYQLSGPKPD